MKIGFALTGSFCTHAKALQALQALRQQGHEITALLSPAALTLDTRFGTAQALTQALTLQTGTPPISTLPAAEPIGPQRLFDLLIVAPCTGNTLAKLAAGITDNAVTLAVKSHLRRELPVLLALSTNDGLSAAAVNIGTLLNRKHYFFVPFRQDAPHEKPRSLVADFDLLPAAATAAAAHRQLQPILTAPLTT